jgi:choice-of-anchor B domain-containing protein
MTQERMTTRVTMGLAVWAAMAGTAATSLAAGLPMTGTTSRDPEGIKAKQALPAYRGPGYRAGVGAADAFEAVGFTLRSWLTLGEFGDHASGNDCWGYVSEAGREYAIMGLQKGYGVVEITDPDNPTIIANIEGPASLWHDAKVLGDYFYGVSEGGGGVQVVDLRDVDNGIATLVQDKAQAGHRSTHNIAANPDSGYLYLCGANIQNGGLVALSLEDPENPTIEGAWNAFYVHDATIVSYTEGPMAGREIAFCASGTGVGFGDTGLRVVDVTDKNNMHLIGEAFWSMPAYSHQCWLSEDKQLLYLGDELDEMGGVGTTRTMVFDVSDPASPKLVNTFTNGSTASDHNMYTKGGYLYQANYTSGLRVYDVASDPDNPKEVAYFDTHPDSNAVTFNGAWSVYPFFPSGNMIISDMQRGLFVVTPGGVRMDIVGGDPGVVPLNEFHEIELDVRGFQVELNLSTVTLHASVDGGEMVAYPMKRRSDDASDSVFAADLPRAEVQAGIAYFFSVETVEGEAHTTNGYYARVSDISP